MVDVISANPAEQLERLQVHEVFGLAGGPVR